VKVVKFGGTSLQTSERIATVIDIVRECAETTRVVVVVSAIGGVTNALNAGATDSASGKPTGFHDLLRLHFDLLADTAGDKEIDALRAKITEAFAELADLCRGVALLRECSARTRDAILGHGERLSALIVAAGLRRHGVEAAAVDARSVIVTDDNFGGARVDNDSTVSRIVEHLGRHNAVPVVTGFIAATRGGDTTTLGRGGSDYTAALLGSALGADVVEIWTDVDGVMSADPRIVPGAFSLETLTYDELMELSHFGAKVVYPPTVHPARQRGIPIVIRNTMNRGFPGTRIVRDASHDGHAVRGISSINDIALLRVEGDGMIGVPGIAARLLVRSPPPTSASS